MRVLILGFLFLTASPFVHSANSDLTSSLEELIPLLNSELEFVKEANRHLSAGKVDTSAKVILAHFQTKPFDFSKLELPTLNEWRFQEAEKILKENKITLLRQEKSLWEKGKIRWDRTDEFQDKEWSWMFNRHGFLINLYYHFLRTNDPSALVEIDEILSNWLNQNPYPEQLSFSPSWRALEASRRILNSWTFLFYKLQPHEEFSAETRIRILISIANHADVFKNYSSFWGGNHLLTELRALKTIAHAWPEFKDSDSWKTYATEEFEKEILSQTYPDGSYKELSNHYHRVVLLNAHEFLKLSENPSSETKLFQRIEKMWEFFHASMKPNGQGPLNNASDLENNLGILNERADFYDRPDLKVIPFKPKPSHDLFEWAGQAYLRGSNNNKSPLWVYFDFGPYGTAHQHDDRLHLSVAFGEQSFLTDTGRYNYLPGKWRDYFKGSKSHNGILINGKSAIKAPLEVSKPLPYFKQEFEDWVLIAAKSQIMSNASLLKGSAQHYRTVIRSDQNYLIVVDELITFSSSDIEIIWNFGEGIDSELARQGLSLITDHNFGIKEYLGNEDIPAGWLSIDYNKKTPILQRVYQVNISRPSTLFWLIQNPENPNPIQLKVSSSKAHLWKLEIQSETDSKEIIYQSSRHQNPFFIHF